MAENEDLVLDSESGFTIGGFIRTVYDRVPATISREQILATLEALQRSYDVPSLEDRFLLFADDIVIEDPAGLLRGEGREGMEAFFRSTFDNGVGIDRRPIERIVVGNEAIERSDMTLLVEGLEPHPLAHVVHYTFDDEARIRRMRVFFDMESIFR
jgi:hypothetical protein